MRMWSAGSRSGEPGSATAKVRNACLPIWIATYAPTKRSARLPNAAGIAIDMTRLASMMASTSSRTGTASGSSWFVTQVV